jgi:AcrR family transcriptional regulator
MSTARPDVSRRAPRSDDTERLTAEERRAALLAVAKELVVGDGPEAVTMGSVAERAGVTRALVYKHFDNRDDVLEALYRREAGALDRVMRDIVLAAGPGLESKLRALVGAILDSADHYGSFFRLLRQVSGSRSARADRRGWDRRTVGYFTSLVVDETDLDERTARMATSLLLTPLQTLRTHVLADPTSRQLAVDTYVDLVLGGLERLSTHRRRR